MGSAIAAIGAGLTNAVLAIIGKLMTQAMFEAMLTKILIYMLTKLSASTENKLDDKLVSDVVQALEAK